MNRIKNFMSNIVNNLKTTITRFPLAVVFLASLSVSTFLITDNYVSLDMDILSRYIYAGIFGFFLSVTLQFILERFEKLDKPVLLYALAIILTIAYYYFMTNNDFTSVMFIHLLVISFALFASYLYLPSFNNDVNFGNVALAHFKGAFTSILYALVLYLGIVAIIGAIDILLYDITYKAYAHAANIIFIFFAPLYYLSLLPKFNSEDEADGPKKEIAFMYPKFLDILVSYITIPLITGFTIVLLIYFVKILVTGVWPVGQVGPMVLGYSAAGYFIYILSSNLNNKTANLYRKLFPIILLPLLAMQLVSSYIRIDAYGITESRYYVVLFGIFSMICALILIFGKKKNPNTIVLLSAIFALVSIVPPVGAFTVSKNSQQKRIEEILLRNNMLVNGEIVQRTDISADDKYEITNISNYLYGMGYLNKMDWFPEEYSNNYYGDFRNIYGFNQYYSREQVDKERVYLNVNLDDSEVILLEEYDILLKIATHSRPNDTRKIGEFTLKGNNYILEEKYDEKGSLTILISEGTRIIVEIDMESFVEDLFEKAEENRPILKQEDLTVTKENDEMKVKILINNINIDRYNPNTTYVYMDTYVFIAIP